MSLDDSTWQEMQRELEKLLGKDKKFGPLHRLEVVDDEQLILAWDPQLRAKAKSLPSAYMQFMETIADCLAEYGFCLEADDDASETNPLDYLLIVPEDDFEDDED
jgi:hypothetical protein